MAGSKCTPRTTFDSKYRKRAQSSLGRIGLWGSSGPVHQLSIARSIPPSQSFRVSILYGAKVCSVLYAFHCSVGPNSIPNHPILDYPTLQTYIYIYIHIRGRRRAYSEALCLDPKSFYNNDPIPRTAAQKATIPHPHEL